MRPVGVVAGVTWAQLVPFHIQVSLALELPKPPNSITLEFAASYTMAAPSLTPGLVAGAAAAQTPLVKSHVSFNNPFALVPVSPPNRTTFPCAASYTMEAS